jgi:hypothetical protein
MPINRNVNTSAGRMNLLFQSVQKIMLGHRNKKRPANKYSSSLILFFKTIWTIPSTVKK